MQFRAALAALCNAALQIAWDLEPSFPLGGIVLNKNLLWYVIYHSISSCVRAYVSVTYNY